MDDVSVITKLIDIRPDSRQLLHVLVSIVLRLNLV
jgi:hypothetical protein